MHEGGRTEREWYRPEPELLEFVTRAARDEGTLRGTWEAAAFVRSVLRGMPEPPRRTQADEFFAPPPDGVQAWGEPEAPEPDSPWRHPGVWATVAVCLLLLVLLLL